MAEEESPLSLLNLVMEKGPRSGETLRFLPTNPPIRVGRVVRGNSLPIKDPGISTKHLIIEFKSPNWLITDLGSSNGTLLNSSNLLSLSPAVLRDGDFVKIGEVTVFRVGICDDGVSRGRLRREEKGEVFSENVGGAAEVFEKKTRGGSRRGKEKVPDVGQKGKSGDDVSRGRMRREKAAEEYLGESGFGGELGKEDVGVAKRGKGRPKKEKDEIFLENVGVAAEVFEKKTRGRRGKEKVPDLGSQVSPRRTRSKKMVENAEKEDVEKGKKEIASHFGGVKVTQKGKERNNKGKKGDLIDVRSGDGLNSEGVVVKSEPRESFCEVEKLGSLGTDKEERERVGERDKESGSKTLEVPDLAKMTLRDYFDYLEVALPKQIIKESELIIAEMHKKAEMYREFVREQKKGKGTSK